MAVNQQRTTSSFTISTIGHSTRPIDECMAILKSQGTACLADVRTIPRSRRNPQYNSRPLSETLNEAGIRYLHCPGLGGLRKPRRMSHNAGWNNAGFQGFADYANYMETEEFEQALAE